MWSKILLLVKKKYVGFFVYFDEITSTDQTGQIHVLFIADPHDLRKENGLPIEFVYYCITLLYSYDYVYIVSEETRKISKLEMEPKEVLKAINPHVFEELGEEEALSLITKLTQMISYLSATNADFNQVKKPTKKPDLKRVKITDAESETWSLGDFFITPTKSISTRYINIEKDTYNRTTTSSTLEKEKVVVETKTEEKEGEEEKVVYVREKEKGYHVRPHMRRAHWKFYWYGKKDGTEERIKRRKFVSAVFINQTGEEIEIPTRETIRHRF